MNWLRPTEKQTQSLMSTDLLLCTYFIPSVLCLWLPAFTTSPNRAATFGLRNVPTYCDVVIPRGGGTRITHTRTCDVKHLSLPIAEAYHRVQKQKHGSPPRSGREVIPEIHRKLCAFGSMCSDIFRLSNVYHVSDLIVWLWYDLMLSVVREINKPIFRVGSISDHILWFRCYLDETAFPSVRIISSLRLELHCVPNG